MTVEYEVWGQFVDLFTIDQPFLRYSSADEEKAHKQYRRLVVKFPHISFSLVKMTRETIHRTTGTHEEETA